MPEIRIRKAVLSDSDAILAWRNHPGTRKFFFDPGSIDAQTHRAWFSASLNNPARHLLVAENAAGAALGIVRFDMDGDQAEIDIYLVPDSRGKRLGLPMLRAAIEWLRNNTGAKQLRADVVPENAASLRMFAAAGFETAAHRMVFDLGQ